MGKIKNRYTKYVDLWYDDNGVFQPMLCGKMPLSARKVWRDTHLDGALTAFSDENYVPVYSYQRGWRWNRNRIIAYLKENSLKECDIDFILYHERALREVLGDKHFRDLLRELGWNEMYKLSHR